MLFSCILMYNNNFGDNMLNKHEEINIYCDESCHLENEECKTMVVACLRCPKEQVQEISNDIVDIKKKHKIWKYAEIKWTKVSRSKRDFYVDLLNYFFDNPYLKFRAIIIDKSTLNHPARQQNHNTWYFKMIYYLVDKILQVNKSYNVYVDKKENSYQAKHELKLTEQFLQRDCENLKLQNITSYKSELMQLNDFIQGIVCFYNRGLHLRLESCETKKELVEIVKSQGIDLKKTNYNTKFNLLFWESRDNA